MQKIRINMEYKPREIPKSRILPATYLLQSGVALRKYRETDCIFMPFFWLIDKLALVYSGGIWPTALAET